MGANVTFNPVTKVIEVTKPPVLIDGELVVDIDFKIDIYSDGKEDFLTSHQLQSRGFPLRPVGGDPLPGSKKLGSTFFVASDWKIKPYEGNHRFIMNGNVYSEDGTSPFIPPYGAFSVFFEQQVSSLVDSTVAQLDEIQTISFNNEVLVDFTSPYSGTAYPIGNQEYPVNNIQDAVTIANGKGFRRLSIIGNAVFDTGDVIDNFKIVGQAPTLSFLQVNDGASAVKTQFENCTLAGVMDGNSTLKDSIVWDLEYFSGTMHQIAITDSVIQLGGGNDAVLLHCYAATAGGSTPTIDMGGAGQSLTMGNYNGDVLIINKTGNDPIDIYFNAGKAILDATVTDGIINIYGGELEDNSTGTTVVNHFRSPTAIETADATWDKVIA